MTLRLKINLIVGALTVLFVAAVIALQLRSMRDSVHEEVVAANRVAAQLLNRTALRYAAQGTPAMLAFLQGVGRVRSNDIELFDVQGKELYRSPPSPYKAGRDAPDWFEALISPPPSSVVGFERFIAWTIRQRAAGTYACFAVTIVVQFTAIVIFQVRETEP